MWFLKIPYFLRRASLFLGILIVSYFLYTTYRLGQVRYFDADEVAYLHWAHNVFSGKRPYYDFFFYIPSGFLYLLSPLFIFIKGASILFVSRALAFGIEVGIVGAMIVLYKKWRGSWFGIVAAILVLFLPIPKDKFIEVRPDNLSVLLFLLGLIHQMIAMERSKKNQSVALNFLNRNWFWAGCWYAISIVILPKTLPQVAVAGLMALFFPRHIRTFITGLLVPIVGFVLFQLGSAKNMSELSMLWYSLTKLPFEINNMGILFPILQSHYFYPNDVYYSQAGVSSIFLANHFIWITGLLMGAYRLVTPFLPKGKNGVWTEVLLSSVFFVNIVMYIYGYPMRHAQYLIPIAVFVALYTADFVEALWIRAKINAVTAGVFVGIILMTLITGISLYKKANDTKMKWTNAGDVRVIGESQRLIKSNEYVLDMTGSTIYYADPYYVSALPFGQYTPYVSRALLSLSTALEHTKTRYIYEGRLDRLSTLGDKDRAYIRANYKKYENTDFYVRNDQ